jgi:hypothetical protein
VRELLKLDAAGVTEGGFGHHRDGHRQGDRDHDPDEPKDRDEDTFPHEVHDTSSRVRTSLSAG